MKGICAQKTREWWAKIEEKEQKNKSIWNRLSARLRREPVIQCPTQ
jgi:hypothetical protein